MSFEVKGKVIAQPTKVSGVGQNGPWSRTTVVLEVESEYPYKLALENQNKAEDFARLREGDVITAKFRVSSREYNGKWYTSVTCFNWSIAASAEAPEEAAPQPQQTPLPPMPPQPETEPKEDDLPF